MTKRQLLKELRRCAEERDPETAHEDADMALLAYIGDEAIYRAYVAVKRWYA